MNLPRIIKQVFHKPWCIEASAHEAIQQLIKSKIEGSALDFEPGDAPEIVQKLGKVAVLNISGVLLPKCSTLEKVCGAMSCADIRTACKQLAADPVVETVILNFDSPGGVVQSIVETARAISSLGNSKATIAYTNGDMCSAAYWLATACHEIIASESACVGSIGVRLSLLTYAEALKKEGVKLEAFSGGLWKTLGEPARDMTDDERALLQAGVDKIYAQFKATVSAARPGVSEETMQGQTFDGDEAKEAGLVDLLTDDLSDLITLTSRG